ncbi:MAG: serine hydrolase [Clostridia bacterium]|nr:serine hydrolase [Clostridia bacterium]
METENRLIGMEIFGCKISSLFRESEIGTLYIAEGNNEFGSSVSMIYHGFFPNEKQYNQIMLENSNDAAAVDEYISVNMEILASKLEQLKSISAENSVALAPVYDYIIEKIEGTSCYNIYIRTCPMQPFFDYISENGLSVIDALRVGMQMLNGANYAHANGLFHGRIDENYIFVDSQGNCKIFGFVIAETVLSPSFNMAQVMNVSAKDDIAAIAHVVYKLFNDMAFPVAPPYDDISLSKWLASGDAENYIYPPSRANGEIASVILRAFANPANSYVNCDEFVSALGHILNATDSIYLNATLIAPAESSMASSQTYNMYSNTSHFPNPNQHSGNSQQNHQTAVDRNNYSDTAGTASSTVRMDTPPVVVPRTVKPKKSKGLIITLVVLLAILLGVGIVALLWACNVVNLDFIFTPSTDISEKRSDVSVEFLMDSYELKYGSTYVLELNVSGIEESELTFESSDSTIAEVSESGIVTAVDEGSAHISVYGKNGYLYDTITITVSPKPVVNKIDVDQIEAMLTGNSDYGLYVVDVAENKEYVFGNSYNILGSSALVCLPILYTYGYDIEMGYMNTNSTVRFRYTYENGRGIFKSNDHGKELSSYDMVASMLKYGDNNCINSLMDYFGINYINEVMSSNGMTGVNVVRNLDPNPADTRENQISAYACGQILNAIITDKVAPRKDFMINNFSVSDSLVKKGLGKHLPDGIVFLNHNAITSSKYNEVAYIESGNQKFIIAYLSNNGNAENNAILAGEIGKYIYDSFMSYDN